MKVYKTLHAVGVFDEKELEEVIHDLSEQCNMIIIDGYGSKYEFGIYCIGTDIIEKYYVDVDEGRVELEEEYRIEKYTDDEIIAGPIVIQRISKYSNIWSIGGTYFGDVASELDFSNYDDELANWFIETMEKFLEFFDEIGAKGSFEFGTTNIRFDGITEEVARVGVNVELCGHKFSFNVYGDCELIEGKVMIPLPDGGSMPIGILGEKEFWVGLKKLLCQ